MKFLQRIKNLIRLSKIEITDEKEKQLMNVIMPERPKQAQIIHLKSQEDIIKNLIEDR